jgi:hypothetical protein
MTTLTEGRYPLEYLVSELPNGKSRTIGAVLVEGNNLDTGTVLGKVAGGYTALDAAGAGGAEVAAGILMYPVDATDDDKPCVVHNWACDVNDHDIIWPDGIADPAKATAIGQLAALKIRLIKGV